MSEQITTASCIPCNDTSSRDWYAWNDLMPPQPDYFNLTGEVYVPNPGVTPMLAVADPQGVNPDILILDLYLYQQPGNWPRVFVWKPVALTKKITIGYKQVTIRCSESDLVTIGVDTVS